MKEATIIRGEGSMGIGVILHNGGNIFYKRMSMHTIRAMNRPDALGGMFVLERIGSILETIWEVNSEPKPTGKFNNR